MNPGVLLYLLLLQSFPGQNEYMSNRTSSKRKAVGSLLDACGNSIAIDSS